MLDTVVLTINKGVVMEYSDVMDSIRDTMCDMDGEEIVKIHNDICSTKIKYDGDSEWSEVDECRVDADGCLIDNDGDAETDMEQLRRDEKNGLYKGWFVC